MFYALIGMFTRGAVVGSSSPGGVHPMVEMAGRGDAAGA